MTLFIDLAAVERAAATLKSRADGVDPGYGPYSSLALPRLAPSSAVEAVTAATACRGSFVTNTRQIASCIEVSAEATRLADQLESAED